MWTSARAAPAPAFSTNRAARRQRQARHRDLARARRHRRTVVRPTSGARWRRRVREAVGASGLPRALSPASASPRLVRSSRSIAGLRPLSVSPSGASRTRRHRLDGSSRRRGRRPHHRRPAMMFCAISAARCRRRCSRRSSPGWRGIKPETFAKAAHFLGLTDFLRFVRRARCTRSLCTVACKFGYLAHEKRWPRRIFRERRASARSAAGGFARLGADIFGAGNAGRARADRAKPPPRWGSIRGRRSGPGLIDAHAGALGTLGASVGGQPADPRRRLR